MRFHGKLGTDDEAICWLNSADFLTYNNIYCRKKIGQHFLFVVTETSIKSHSTIIYTVRDCRHLTKRIVYNIQDLITPADDASGFL